MCLYKRMLIISITMCIDLWKTAFFRDKYSFSSWDLSQILLSFMEKFKTGVGCKRLTEGTRANSNSNGDQSNFLGN